MPHGVSLYQITGRVPPVTDMSLVPGVTPPAELAKVERLMASLPIEWVIYYKLDFSKDLPAVRELQNGSTWQFDEFLSASYERADEDGLVVLCAGVGRRFKPHGFPPHPRAASRARGAGRGRIA